jgi:ABC-2 type transport system permease protein/oleandomycin transport system permease protein
MARSAVLTGRTSADTFRNVFVLILMTIVGVLVGWTIDGNALEFVGGMLLMLLFGYAMSWIFAVVGLVTRDPETAQAAAFPVMAPLVFASTAFVPASTMPSWLQGWAENQPLSVVTDAVRGLTSGQVDASDVWTALAWCIGIIAVAAPLAVWRYRRAE